LKRGRLGGIGQFGNSEFVQGRQHECRGLARTGLRRDEHIAAGDTGRNGLRLDWGWYGVAGVGYCLNDGRVEA
jgi:hypothetical protein